MKLSVGIAQIQIKHWHQYGFLDNENRFRALFIISNDLNNYDLAMEIVKDRLNEPINYSKILAYYRGETRAYHLKVFLELKYYIDSYYR